MLPHARKGNNNIKSYHTRINVQLWDITTDQKWDRVSYWDRASYHTLYHEVKYWSCILKFFHQLTYLLQWSFKIRDPMMAMLHQRITVHETQNSNHHQKSQSDWQTRRRDAISVIYEQIFIMLHLKIITESIQWFPHEWHIRPLSQLYLTLVKSHYTTKYSIESPFSIIKLLVNLS